MVKLHGWRSALNEVILQAAGKPFSWENGNDCAFGLAFPAIFAQVGKDLAAPYRNRYTTAFGAMRLLRQEGYGSVADYVGAHFERCEQPEAQYGDIAVLQGDETGTALGLVLGERIGVLAPSGYGTVDRCLANFAFRIG